MRILAGHTIAVASLLAAVGFNSAARADERVTVTTIPADQVAEVPGRSGAEAFWMHRADIGVPGPVQRAYTGVRAVLADPIPVEDPQFYGRGGGYIGLDKLYALQ